MLLQYILQQMHRDGTTELAAYRVESEAFHISFYIARTIQYTREATEFQVPKFNLILYSLCVDVWVSNAWGVLIIVWVFW